MTSKKDFEKYEIHLTPRPPMEWMAYCITCNQKLYEGVNGDFVEAAARSHNKDNAPCKVIVGYEVKT